MRAAGVRQARFRSGRGEVMSAYVVKPLTAATWDGFAAMVERHNGVFGGCWCTWFHTMSADKERTYEGNRSLKRRLVEEDRAHAALVYDGSEVVAWCEYGSPEELPNIYHRKQYEESSMSCPPIGSPASSWTSDTGGVSCRRSPSRGRSTWWRRRVVAS